MEIKIVMIISLRMFMVLRFRMMGIPRIFTTLLKANFMKKSDM